MTEPRSDPILYDPSVEHVDADERQTFADIGATMGSIRETTFANGGRPLRSVHAKAQGALRATLVVDVLPDELAQGLFARPGRFDVVMRFSTSPGDVLDDRVSVPRGLGFKVLGVEGERLSGSEGDTTQNFVFADAPAFGAPSARAFLGNLKQLAATTDRAEGAKRALSATLQVVEKMVEAFGGKSAKLVSLGGHAPTHVLGHTYFTAAALRHGRYVAKLRLLPASPELQALAGAEVDLADRPDGLRDEVVAFMREHRAEWLLQVQLCTDAERMPIEDASVEWSEELSPYRTVARVVAEPQTAWSDAHAAFVDQQLFFSPWRGLAAHRPLGNVMRARKIAYEQSAQFRAARNGRPVAEPHNLSEYPR